MTEGEGMSEQLARESNQPETPDDATDETEKLILDASVSTSIGVGVVFLIAAISVCLYSLLS